MSRTASSPHELQKHSAATTFCLLVSAWAPRFLHSAVYPEVAMFEDGYAVRWKCACDPEETSSEHWSLGTGQLGDSTFIIIAALAGPAPECLPKTL